MKMGARQPASTLKHRLVAPKRAQLLLRLTYILCISIAITALSLASPRKALAVVSITAHSDIHLTATISDFDAGNKDSLSNTVTYRCDQGFLWRILVRSLDANLGQSDDATYTKPLSDLRWKGGDQGTWIAMTTSDATVINWTFQFSGTQTVDIDYRFLLSWANDKPGTYQATIQYTITTLF